MGATYTKRGKSYRIAVHAYGERAYVTVKSEADAKALVREVKRLELNGQNVLDAIKSARSAPPTTTTPTTFFPPTGLQYTNANGAVISH